MEIGNKLKEKRMAAKLSQEALAERIGVTRQTISSWENNRSYPDIGSILKLSDLYDTSLDELLKEDENMRKHMEKTAGMADKVLNVLFVTSVLLLPVSMLLWHWELAILGGAARLISMVLMFVFLFFRLRINSEPWPVWLLAVVVWGALYIPDLILLLSNGGAGGMGGEYILLGVVLLYSRGTVFKTRLAFWETIVLYFGIPIFIAVSTMWPTILEEGAFPDPANPFGHTYRVEESIYLAEDAQLPEKIVLFQEDQALIMDDGEAVGFFEAQERQEGSDESQWRLVPTEDPTDEFLLISHNVDGTYLTLEWASYRPLSDLVSRDTLWKVKLERLPELRLYLRGEGLNETSCPLQWTPEGREPNITTSSQIGAMENRASIRFGDEAEELPVIVEVHGDTVETQELVLTRDKDGEFHLPEYPEDAEYLLARVPWKNGAFWFRIDLKE